MEHNEVDLAENDNQFGAAIAIKEEVEVKEEPVDELELVEDSAALDPDIKIEPDDYTDDVNDSVANSNQNVIKAEVKHEMKRIGQRGQAKASTHRSTQHKCQICGYGAKYKSILDKHLLKHTGEKPFPCNHCRKKFTQKHILQYHMKIHAKEFLFSCAVCFEGFDKNDQKLKHEKECRVLRYECHLCKQSFGSMKTNLMDHIRIHSGTKPFQCIQCSKQFAKKSNLKIHMTSHAGPPSFHCSRCRQGYVHQNEMVAHEQKCSRRLYECYVCRKFIGLKKGHLKLHMRTHSGDKPFRCEICRHQFTAKSSLKPHTNRFHNKKC